MEQEAQKMMLQNAFFRKESAIWVALTILLTAFFHPFVWWPWWAWLVIGAIGEVALVISSLTDKAEQQRIVENLFREKYNASGIRDRNLRAKLDEAEQYHQRIRQVVEQQKSGILRDRMQETAGQVYDWIANMVKLAQRIDSFRSDQIIQRDLKNVPGEVDDLTRRLAREANPQVRDQINTTLSSTRQFAANLSELDARMQRADLQLDHSLAALGTVYSQMLLVGTSEVDSDRAERLRGDIRNEVAALQDLVESLNEVYSFSAGDDTMRAQATAVAQQAARRQQAAGK
jgi:hypothetical protein